MNLLNKLKQQSSVQLKDQVNILIISLISE